jgi:hypothetical protein
MLFLSEFDLGFIMGLVIGEGSFTGDRHRAELAIRLHESDPEPLRLIQMTLGGRIYGPYCHGGRRYFHWSLSGKALYDAVPIFEERLPPSRKRDQFLVWIEKYGLRAKLAKRASTR